MNGNVGAEDSGGGDLIAEWRYLRRTWDTGRGGVLNSTVESDSDGQEGSLVRRSVGRIILPPYGYVYVCPTPHQHVEDSR